ncbi:MAG: MBL fold metallo-hydrolase [Simkaniaceae bacterium]|nr:MBL fold metallo-hydrolase [Simkaniaceae bacterium]
MGAYNDKYRPPKLPNEFAYPNPKLPINPDLPTVTWINHCTFFISINGMNILTDPIWSKRCSPLPFFGPKRIHDPAFTLDELPKIDYILISHDPYDHLDKKTVKTLIATNPNIHFIVPLGLKKWFIKLGAKQVDEFAWWEEKQVNSSIKITFVPSQHYSGRNFWNGNRSLWGGYVIDFNREGKDNKRLYFVGDTGYNQVDFKMIGEHFKEMDLSLIPIGTYVPHKFMETVHINPSKATEIHKEVRSKLSIGMHWKTFRLSSEGEYQPPYDLFLSMKFQNLDPLNFRCVEPGQVLNW